MPTTLQTVTIEICVDCLSIIANGESESDENGDGGKARAEAIARNWPGINSITLGSESCGDCEGSFSKSPCGACTQTLAGTRYCATGWYESAENGEGS